MPIPQAWYVVDAVTGGDVQVCKGRWGTLLIPPGRYDIHLQPEGPGGVKAPYIRDLMVVPGKRVILKLDTGVEIQPAKWMGPPRWWAVLDPRSRNPLRRVEGTWGKTLTPPGKYLIGVQPGGYNTEEVVFGPFDVHPHRLNKVVLRSGVRLLGPEGSAPVSWSVLDRETGRVVQTVRGAWGAALVPPGTYKITVRLPAKEGEKEVVASEKVVVGEGLSDVVTALPKSGD